MMKEGFLRLSVEINKKINHASIHKLEELEDAIHAHPTLSESVKEAAEDALGMPINKDKLKE